MIENTPMSEGTAQNQNNPSVQNTNVSTETTSHSPSTPRYTDADVNNIVAGKKQKFIEQGKQEALAEWQKQQQPNAQTNGSSGLTPEQIKEEVKKALQAEQEELQKKQFEAQWQQSIQNLAQKVKEGASRYPDFDDVTSKVDFRSIPEVVTLLTEIDNPTDVIYDLANNQQKIADIAFWANRNPQQARMRMQAISNSIKQNQAAQNQPSPKEPLNQLNPSNIGMGNGSSTIRDFKNKYRG